MGRYIPRHLRPNLAKYKYQGEDKSLVSRYVLSPYWNWLVKQFPLWVAPNAITLLGLSLVFLNFLTLIYYYPSLQPSPKPLHISQPGGTWDPLFPPPTTTALPAITKTIRQIYQTVRSFVSYNSTTGVGPDLDIGMGGILDGDKGVGRWIFLSWAVGLFLYQSLDAIDGKQARRTGTSSPLGEMFDHGCDALNTTLEVLLCATALNLGHSWWTIASQVATIGNFYLTTWEEYHTHVLFLSQFSGPVEGILLIVGIYVVTFFQGPSFWDQGILTFTKLDRIESINNLGLKNLPLNECFMVFGAIGLLFNILASYSDVVQAAKKAGKSTVKPLIGLIPILLQTLFQILFIRSTSSLLFSPSSHLLIPFMCSWGISFSYQVGQLILSHVISAPFPYWNFFMVWQGVGCVLATSGALEVGFWVWLSLVLSVGMYGWLVGDVVSDLCDFFDINCLTIKKKKQDDGVIPTTTISTTAQGEKRTTAGDEKSTAASSGPSHLEMKSVSHRKKTL